MYNPYPSHLFPRTEVTVLTELNKALTEALSFYKNRTSTLEAEVASFKVLNETKVALRSLENLNIPNFCYGNNSFPTLTTKDINSLSTQQISPLQKL